MEITFLNEIAEKICMLHYSELCFQENYIEEFFVGDTDDFVDVIYPRELIETGSKIKIACGPIKASCTSKEEHEIYLIIQTGVNLYAVIMEKSMPTAIYKVNPQFGFERVII
ncbi:hypothetical protein [Cytobacillus sp. FSL H8-0458]|uniref:hypothetical protein n=1 Tax=Cytobacillus sp. FSL H8-0458 TaxID=2975346 RepID=UPI0030F97258